MSFLLVQVYDMETSYLQDPSQCGNVLKGFEGFLSSSKNTALYGVAIILFFFHFALLDNNSIPLQIYIEM